MMATAVRQVLDHAEIVADEQIGQLGFLPELMNRFSTCAWIDTRAPPRLRRTPAVRLTASARAMPMRLLCPPENWWGKRRGTRGRVDPAQRVVHVVVALFGAHDACAIGASANGLVNAHCAD